MNPTAKAGGLSMASAGLRSPASTAPTIGTMTDAQCSVPKTESEGQARDLLRPRCPTFTSAQTTADNLGRWSCQRTWALTVYPLGAFASITTSIPGAGCVAVSDEMRFGALPFLRMAKASGFLGDVR